MFRCNIAHTNPHTQNDDIYREERYSRRHDRSCIYSFCFYAINAMHASKAHCLRWEDAPHNLFFGELYVLA
jgi:hypothetical protein